MIQDPTEKVQRMEREPSKAEEMNDTITKVIHDIQGSTKVILEQNKEESQNKEGNIFMESGKGIKRGTFKRIERKERNQQDQLSTTE